MAAVVQQALTAEAVNYASVACGALFRWASGLLIAATRCVEQREAAEAKAADLKRQLDGLAQEVRAVEGYAAQLEADANAAEARRVRTAAALTEAEQAVVECERRRSAAAAAAGAAAARREANTSVKQQRPSWRERRRQQRPPPRSGATAAPLASAPARRAQEDDGGGGARKGSGGERAAKSRARLAARDARPRPCDPSNLSTGRANSSAAATTQPGGRSWAR